MQHERYEHIRSQSVSSGHNQQSISSGLLNVLVFILSSGANVILFCVLATILSIWCTITYILSPWFSTAGKAGTESKGPAGELTGQETALDTGVSSAVTVYSEPKPKLNPNPVQSIPFKILRLIFHRRLSSHTPLPPTSTKWRSTDANRSTTTPSSAPVSKCRSSTKKAPARRQPKRNAKLKDSKSAEPGFTYDEFIYVDGYFAEQD